MARSRNRVEECAPGAAGLVGAPHHAGHRERLRQRARAGGLGALPDYELLELFLFRSQPQGDVKPVAKALLGRFGSLGGVLAASVEDLTAVRATDARGRTRGIGEQTALDLRALHETARRVAKEEPARRPVISSWTALLSYVRLALQHEPREQFRVLYLDRKNCATAARWTTRRSIRARWCAGRWSCRRPRSSWCTITPRAIRLRRARTSR